MKGRGARWELPGTSPGMGRNDGKGQGKAEAAYEPALRRATSQQPGCLEWPLWAAPGPCRLLPAGVEPQLLPLLLPKGQRLGVRTQGPLTASCPSGYGKSLSSPQTLPPQMEHPSSPNRQSPSSSSQATTIINDGLLIHARYRNRFLIDIVFFCPYNLPVRYCYHPHFSEDQRG